MAVTIIPVQYRDANNYKRGETYVLSGAITDAERVALQASLEGEDGFIPMQIGLEHVAAMTEWQLNFTEDGDDHVWHELNVDDIEVSERDLHTMDEFSTVSDFVAAMVAAKASGWDASRTYDL